MLNVRRVHKSPPEDYHPIGCTLIWDSGRVIPHPHRQFVSAVPNQRKKSVEGDLVVHRNRVLAKIKYFELKNRKPTTSQLKIQFDDSAVQTHEYPREEVALEEYLSTNPSEVEEAKREERERDEEPPEDPMEGPQIADTPREVEEAQETPRKNFTSSLEAGELSKYKPKHQEEFVFGMSLKEPEKVPVTEVTTETSTEDDLHLRPADEEDLHDFSTHETSDMLF